MADPAWSRHLVETLSKFQMRGYLCDMDIIAADGTTVKVHSCVVAAMSTLPLLKSPTDRTSVTTSIPSSLLACAIQYMYTGKVTSEEEQQLSMVYSTLAELGIGQWCQKSGVTNVLSQPQVSPPADQERSFSDLKTRWILSEECADDARCMPDGQEGEAQSASGFAIHAAGDMMNNFDSKNPGVKSETSMATSAGPDEPTADSETENEDKMKLSGDWKCEKCGKTFKSRKHLQKHERAAHSKASPQACPLCGSKVKTKNSLAAHLRYIHQSALGPNQDITPVKGEVFQCNICMRSFHRKGHFKRHMLVHSAERPFACSVCHKSFKDRCALESHTRYMHEGHRRLPKKGTEQLDFWCSHCGKCFKHKGSLKVHERTHRGERPFSCRYCPKAFTASSHRTRHEAIHKGQKDFQCAICGKRFSSSGILANHRYTHTDVRPHSCQICGKAFKQKSHKQRHEKLHEKTE